MRRPENDPVLTERLRELHRFFPMVDHLTRNGQLDALDCLLDNMRKKMDDVQFRLNDIRFGS